MSQEKERPCHSSSIDEAGDVHFQGTVSRELHETAKRVTETHGEMQDSMEHLLEASNKWPRLSHALPSATDT